jgi:hypothetical protein
VTKALDSWRPILTKARPVDSRRALQEEQKKKARPTTSTTNLTCDCVLFLHRLILRQLFLKVFNILSIFVLSFDMTTINDFGQFDRTATTLIFPKDGIHLIVSLL